MAPPPGLAAESGARIGDWVAATEVWITLHWQELVVALVIGVAIVSILTAAKRLGQRMMAGRHDPTGWRAIFGRALARTSRIFRILVAAALVAGHAETPALLARSVHVLFTVAAAVQVAIWAREIMLGIVDRRAARETEGHDTLRTATTLIRLFVTFIVFAIAATVILDNLGVNVTGIVAGLGVGGIAIGLAAQGIFSDLFAAIAIIFDKPFRKGDMIEYAPGQQGRVEVIGMKTTRLRAPSGEEVIISNAKLLEKDLRNISQRPYRRVRFVIGVTYQTPPDVCAAIPAMMREIVEAEKLAVANAGFIAFNSSSLDFQVEFDTAADFDAMFDARHRVGIALLRRLANEGIDIAYPTQTSFTAAPDGRYIMPYPPQHSIAAADSPD